MTETKYDEAVYAGVLGKIIGVYLGRPVEGWPYEKIRTELGEVSFYLQPEFGEPLVAADDDISGTFAFFRAIEDHGYRSDTTAEMIGDTWLNYIIENQTILWWGGLGRSTEHTAYLRLKDGIRAPRSGSIALNGSTIAEQIGAQIFIDAFSMATPGDPDQAAALVREAASVSHDGIALDAACLLAAMEAMAFDEPNLDTLLDRALPYITSSLLNKVIDDVRHICREEPNDWRSARAWLDERYGYHIYPGPCHIVPNHAMVLAALLLGGDDFKKSVTIAASAGWDTDCNAGNVGCLNGIRLGLDAITDRIDYREPLGDRMLVVSADGGSCVSDAVQEAHKIIDAGNAMRSRSPIPARPRFSFAFRGSTQGFESVAESKHSVSNLDEPGGGLLLEYRELSDVAPWSVSVPTFLDPSEAKASFATVASPTLYSGQDIVAHVRTLEGDPPTIRQYVLQVTDNGEMLRTESEPFQLDLGDNELAWRVPALGHMPIHRFGLTLESARPSSGRILIRDIDWHGAPTRWGQEGMLMGSIWELEPAWLRSWVSSAERFEPDFKYTLCISHPRDEGVATIGTQDWDDYTVRSTVSLNLHQTGGLVIRSKGHRRYYAGVLSNGDRISIVKRDHDQVIELASIDREYAEERQYRVDLEANGNRLRLFMDDELVLEALDQDQPFLHGGAGLLVERGTMLADGFHVERCSDASS